MQYAKYKPYLVIPNWESGVQYPQGICVKHGDSIIYCNTEHTSGATYIDAYWTVIGGGSSGGVPKLTELVQNVSILSGQSLAIAIDAGTSKFDIRTCYFAADKIGNIQLSIYDKAVNGFCVYASNVEYPIYDIVNVPYEDKDATNALHVVCQNNTGADIAGTIRVKITSLS